MKTRKRKIVNKAIAKDGSYIAITFLCEDGINTYKEKFYIFKENELHTGYGCRERTPDLYVTVFGIKYACFYMDGYTIIQCDKCYPVKEI